jgi:hypothetical protein
VWNGFALVDLTTQTVGAVIQAPPSENFGYDSVHHVIYAPFYDCRFSALQGSLPSSCNTPMQPNDAGVMTDGLSVIDLTTSTVYTYEDNGAMFPNAPVGVEPDEAPLETHRARDMNEGDPFIHIACGDGTEASLAAGPRRRRHYICADGSVPRGRTDLRAALAAKDAHAKAVCASRAYLAAHMDDDGREAFAESLRECAPP